MTDRIEIIKTLLKQLYTPKSMSCQSLSIAMIWCDIRDIYSLANEYSFNDVQKALVESGFEMHFEEGYTIFFVDKILPQEEKEENRRANRMSEHWQPIMKFLNL